MSLRFPMMQKIITGLIEILVLVIIIKTIKMMIKITIIMCYICHSVSIALFIITPLNSLTPNHNNHIFTKNLNNGNITIIIIIPFITIITIIF